LRIRPNGPSPARLFLLVAAFYAGSAPATAAPFIYVVNGALNANTVSVIDAADNTVIATVPVEFGPMGIAITPNGRYADVTNATGNVSVILTATNTVVGTIAVGCFLEQVAIAPDGKHAYTTDVCGRLSVIDVATNAVTASIHVTSFDTVGVAISPDSKRAYVTANTAQLFVIDTTTNTVAAGSEWRNRNVRRRGG
jgi:YVTN family beta-propeller protein